MGEETGTRGAEVPGGKLVIEKGNKLIPDFEPAYPSMPAEEAAEHESRLKQDYEISDWKDPYNPEGYKGWLLRDKRTGGEVIYHPNSRRIVSKEYLRKDENNRPVENVLDLVARVAVNIATAEKKYDPQADILETAKRFASRILHKEFAPNTPTFANAGGHLQQLAACFGMTLEDYLGTDDIGEDPDKQGNGIFDILRYGAMIQKSGGGTGYNFSYTRPKNSGIATTGGRASGPISWIKVYNAGTQEINQGGFRRGANMGVLEYWHPDIFEFLSMKANHSLSFFNLSMGVDEEFGRKLDEDGNFALVNPKDIKTVPLEQRLWTADRLMKKSVFDKLDSLEQEDINPSLLLSEDGKDVLVRYTGDKVGFVGDKGVIQINARATLKYAAKMACLTGCPGIIFFDRMNQDNPTPHIGKIRVVNPCGEQPLLDFESCNLGSVNLYSCVEDVEAQSENPGPDKENKYFYGKIIPTKQGAIQRRFNLNKFGEIVDDGIHFLDNVIDMGKYPFRKVYAHVKSNRKVGLGVMGVAEVAASLGISYESEDMEKFSEFISGYMSESAQKASRELAKKRGVFPNWKGSVYDPESPYSKPDKVGEIRNATQLTIAPNGTTGQFCGVSGGMEPAFGIFFTKTLANGVVLKYRNLLFEEELKLRGLYSAGLVERIQSEGSVQNISEIPDDMKARYKLAIEVSPEWHVRIQAAFQKKVDNAVSKTVNLSEEATPDDFYKIFMMARELGCKGITGYRQGTIPGQPLTITKGKKGNISLEESVVRVHVPMRSKAVSLADKTDKYRIERGDEKFHVVFSYQLMKHKETDKFYFIPHEDFQLTSPPGEEVAVEFSVEGIDRTDILKGNDPDYVKLIERWKSVTGNRSAGLGPNRINSPTHAVGLAFEHAMMSHGIVGYDAQEKMTNLVRKPQLVPATDEEKESILNNAEERAEQHIVSKKVTGFLCADCGSNDYFFEQGCHEPKCNKCGWTKRGNCS